jgi:hypothetical protein
MALSRCGATRINDYGDASDTKREAILCRLHYEQTFKALTRSWLWWFAKARQQLSQDTETPAFQWSYQYTLPTGFLRPILVYDGSDLNEGKTYYSYELEGRKLLIDESTVYMKYVQWVSDVPSWDPLFVEVGVLQLASKLSIGLGRDLKVKADIKEDIMLLMPKVRAMQRNEERKLGRAELRTWREARHTDHP